MPSIPMAHAIWNQNKDLNKKYILASATIMVIAFLLWWVEHRSKKDVQQIPATNPSSSQKSGLAAITPQTSQKQPAYSQSKVTPTSDIPPAVMEYVKKSMADPQYDWKQPINFYGRVVDESNVAVVGASIHFTWNDISKKGTSDANTTSDGNGSFSLNARNGKRLYVDVGKDGYD